MEESKLTLFAADKLFAWQNARIFLVAVINVVFNVTKALVSKLINNYPAEKFVINNEQIATIYALSFAILVKNAKISLAKQKF